MLKRIAALLLALLLMIPAVQIAAAEPDKNLSKNGSYIIGSTGDGVKDIQTLLKGLGYYSGSITGKYTSATATAVRWFQRSNNLPVDGKVGKKTLAALKDPGAVKATDPTAKNTTANGSLTIGSTGQEVANVQQALKDLHYYSGPVDGLFSEDTAAAVKAFQKNNNLTADGVVGAYTMLKLMTGIPWAEEFDHETLTTTYPLPAPAAVGQTQNGSYYKGASGTVIKTYQQKLKDLEYYEGDIDGDFDAEFEAAVKLFQSRNGLTADGILGQKTIDAMYSPGAIKKTDLVPTVYTLSSGSASPFVKNLQTILKNHYFYTGKLDGVYGPDMVAAVKLVQTAAGLVVDGKAGPATQSVILGLPGTLSGYPTRTLKLGSRGYDVYVLQQRLINGNYLTGIYSKGEFDAATQKAVKKAQKTFMITEDGIYGSTLRRYLWATGVAQDQDQSSKYDDWDDNGNFVPTVLKKGSHGEQVKYAQMKLKANGFLLNDADGVYGDSTAKAVLTLQKLINQFKIANGDDNYIKEDGIIGQQTWMILRDPTFKETYSLDNNIASATEGAELVEVEAGKPAIAAITRKMKLGSNGKQVIRLQKLLNEVTGAGLAEDGFFGPQTETAVKNFQASVGIKEDGVVGTQTLFYLNLNLSGSLPGTVTP